MVGKVRVLFAVVPVAVAITVAAPAVADQGDYLDMLLPKYTYLSSQQLLTEGYKSCSVAASGRPASDAIPIVIRDLGISASAAGEIVADALVYLGCD